MAALADAVRALAPLDAPADLRLRQFFRTRPAMGKEDRAEIAEGVYAWLRRKRSTEALAGSHDPRRIALVVLVRDLARSVRDLERTLDTDERE